MLFPPFGHPERVDGSTQWSRQRVEGPLDCASLQERIRDSGDTASGIVQTPLHRCVKHTSVGSFDYA